MISLITDSGVFRAVFAAAVLCVISIAASGIVMHDDSQPADHPSDLVVGRWGSNASCVAIGPDLVITTRHQGNTSTVVIGGVSYGVSEQWLNDNDFRIVRLTLNGQRANLSRWVSISSKTYTLTPVVLGGFGRSRGEALTGTAGNVYGYQWLSETNTTLRWGANRIEFTTSGRLVMDFDAAGCETAVSNEAAIAEYDSGGGWFVKEDGKWVLAGLGSGVESFGRSVFATESGSADPEKDYAIALGEYSDWIESTLSQAMPVKGDTDFDGDVDDTDMANIATGYGTQTGASWSMGNFDGDGDVDLVDLGHAAKH